jgi:LPS-assembly protein
MIKPHSQQIGGTRGLLAGCAVACLLGTVLLTFAQNPVVPPKATDRLTAAPLAGLIDIQADNLSYDAVRRLVIARGNVEVIRGTDSVKADYAEIDTATEQISARGHLLIEYMGNTWEGEEATYNFKTGVGDFGQFELTAPPYHVTARDSKRLSPQLMELKGVMLTTCDPDAPEYSVRASSATLDENETLRAKNVRFHLGPVPFFWFPYVKANVDTFANFEFTPGMSSDMGVFLLTAYNLQINDIFKTQTHVDIREKRGLGVGEDLSWKDPDGSDYEGVLRLYYADDQNPWKDDAQRDVREDLISQDRYWLHLNDRRNITDRDYIITTLNYLSDPWILEDFFDDEYQNNVQPENRITLTHRGNNYNAGVTLSARLNDFYDNVNRLPEVFFNMNRQQILNTPIFYQGENTLSSLDKVYADYTEAEGYEAIRMDTYHMLYWPTRQFGFLSLIPRGGYRGTYFSKTLEESRITNVVAITDDAGTVTGTTNEVEELVFDGDSVWRSLPELGLETSFKAFGDLHHGPTGIGDDEDLRHIAEPYADYTLRFEPNVLPEELWQFDSLDTLTKRNDLTLGMRNFLQTKRNGSSHNLIYADVFTTLLMEPEEGEESFNEIGFRTELRPWRWLSWDFAGAFDTVESEARTLSTQVEIKADDVLKLGLDYRFDRDIRDQIAGDLTLFPEQRWSGRIYARMDLEESELEEHSYYLIHRTRCLGIGLGVRIRPEQSADGDDNITGWIRIWPLAFPGFSSSLGG